MSILLVNDDGINAAGLATARRYLSRLDEVIAVAADRQRSASSHGITLSSPLRLYKLDDYNYRTSGTPADCVKLGIREVIGNPPPRIVIVGINPGGNTGASIHYSGTVAAAAEATMMGIPAVAISVDAISPASYEPAAAFLLRSPALHPGRGSPAHVRDVSSSFARAASGGVRLALLGRIDRGGVGGDWLCGRPGHRAARGRGNAAVSRTAARRRGAGAASRPAAADHGRQSVECRE